jgi:arylsulfatase A-like enzyme
MRWNRLHISVAILMAFFVVSCNPGGPQANRSDNSDGKEDAMGDSSGAIGVMPTRISKAAQTFRNQPSPPAGMNVVVVVVDTLRADRLGAYGHSRNTSPRMDAIAREGTLFHRYYAASPWTAPSFGTMFTGMSPAMHRGGTVLNASDNPRLRGTARRLKGFSLYPVRADIQTVAEQLSCCVDASAAFVSNPFLHPSLGFNRGFGTYDYQTKARKAVDITDAAIDWLKAHAEKQVFAVVHYMDTHQPYAPDESLRREFFPMDGGRLTPAITRKVGELREMMLKENELAFLRGVYDAQVHTVDQHIGRLYDAMAGLQLLDNTWLVITADHGEEHFDHGSFFHGLQYTDEVIRVPLIIRAPGGQWGANNQVAYSACQMDLAPTLLDVFGVSTPASMEGKSLIPLMTGEEKHDRTCYMEMSMLRDAVHSNIENRFRKHALFDGRYKVIQSMDGSSTEVYDLDMDALEQAPIPPAHPGAYKSIRALHQYVRNRQPALEKIPISDGPTRLPEDVSESLENLGYVQ